MNLSDEMLERSRVYVVNIRIAILTKNEYDAP